MDSSNPSDAPPPYGSQAPIGFDAPPTAKVDMQQMAGQPSAMPPGYGPGSAMPPPGNAPGYGYPQQQGSVQVITTQPQVITSPVVVVPGASCPACRAGFLQNQFTCCGICLGICFFPFGLICCFLMREKRCSNCNISYGSSI